jgi:hypothetical protein
MRHLNSVLTVLALGGFPGSSVAEDLLPVPFHTEISSVRAYSGTMTMEFFLVWDSDVIVIALDLPETATGILALDIEPGGCCRITQYHGDGISQYTLPTGPAVPIPPDYQFWSREASGGTVFFGNVPASGEPEYGEMMTVVLDGVDFGDGETHSFGPVEAAPGVYPP